MSSAIHIGFLVFPDLLQLDLTGPYAVLASAPDAHIHLIARDKQPIVSSDRLTITPSATFEDCPSLGIVCVPGGGGIQALLGDAATLEFLRRQAEQCLYLTSVCTGSLVLGAAGLLQGYKATSHWQSLELLRHFGAEPVKDRVVEDRNRITAAGVSSGIDMALLLSGKIWGDEVAQGIQLSMEYDPKPPYNSGSPDTAPEAVKAALAARNAARQAAREKAVERAAAALAAK